jgi:sugar fermentation stimulation protein A
MSIILYQYDSLVNGAKLVKRPSKHIKSPYIADILVNENETLAHCPALGVSGLLNCESDFYCTYNDDEKRKSKYTIEMVYLPSTKNTFTLTNTNPMFGNRIFDSIIQNNIIEKYRNYKEYKKEKTYKDSRFDFYIKKENDIEEYIEIKSVLLCDFEKNNSHSSVTKPEISTLPKYKKAAIFPDGFRKNKNVPISERAIKHLETLTDCKKNNYDASLYFIIQRDDCNYFKPSNIDTFYYEALKKAILNGVNVKAICVKWSEDGSCLFSKFVPVVI